ncbi:MAG: glycosyltransferase family 39 protein [Candidatus Daviesbacteria bacterium]|nr:glycosyltransferase family 39 protein [Candidatus Daviesbacteria bacterium]
MKSFRLFVIYPWLFPAIIFTILVLLGANMHPLWGDEAETALFGRNVLKYALPKGWDGVNIMGIYDAVVLDKDLINHTSPWVQYYLVAISFKLFGESSFAARLPFIILSILSIPLMYILSFKLTQNKFISFLTVLILSISVPFILFAYQARYYSVSSFASILLVLATLHILEKKLWPKLLFVFASVLFFYGNYVSFLAFYISLFLSFSINLLVKKEFFIRIKRFTLLFSGLSIIIAVLTAPWFFILKPLDSRGEIIFPSFFKAVVNLFSLGFSMYNNNNTLPLGFAIFVVAFLIVKIYKKKPDPALTFVALLSFFFLLTMVVFSTMAVADARFIDNRYTTPVFYFMFILSAYIINVFWQWKKIIGLLVLILYAATNFFTFQPLRSFPQEYLHELIYSYLTPDKVVADYLKKYAKDGDTAFVNLDRDHEPLIFHLKDKIRFVNRVTPTNQRIFPENLNIIPEYIYSYLDEPDWVILYSKRGNDRSFLTFGYRGVFPLGLAQTVDLKNHYEEIVLPVYFSDLSRPEIDLRSFSEIKPEYNDQVFIYKKRS